MVTLVSKHASEPWRRRLFLPNYQMQEAARYAGLSVQTVAAWHTGARKNIKLSDREARAALSYLQLIEVAVVAAFRKAGIPMREVKNTRDLLMRRLKSEFPFAEYRFKAHGRELVMDDIEGDEGAVMKPGRAGGGQLGWKEFIAPRLREFDYEGDGFVIRWKVDGPSSPVVIDPRLSFGAPTVRGTPTWVIKGRWIAGESIGDIADDFDLSKTEVRRALKFEDADLTRKRNGKWVH